MKRTWVVTTLLALAPMTLLAGPEGHHRPGGPDVFKSWDTNGDGVVTKEEAEAAGQAQSAKRFDAMDLNKDGQLTQEEIQKGRDDRRAAMKQKLEASFKAADKNGDGALSKDEAAALPRIARHFDQLDADKNGVVTQEELQQGHQRMRGPRTTQSS